MNGNDGQIKIGIEADGAALESYLNTMDKTAADALAGVAKESKSVASELRELEKAAKAGNLALSGFGESTASIGEISGKISEAAGNFGNAVMPFSLATAGIGAAAVKAGMDFEAGMSEVAAVSGASGEALEALKEKAKQMGASTKFSATEASEALNYMAMAGWDTNQMLDGISGVMDLAAASGEDLGAVSDIVTDALTAFGLSAKDSGHFADVLAKASSSSNTNVGMMGATFKYVAPLAGALNYSVEDVGVAIGLMANAGIKGEQAGTSLRGMLSRLINPTNDADWAMKRLGLSVTNTNGTMKPFKQIVDDMRVGFSNMSEAEKATVATSLAGQEAMSGLLAIVNASDADYRKLTESINNADGATAKMAETMQDNLAGDVTMLTSQLERLGIQASEILVPSLRGAADGVSGFLDWLSKLSPGAQKAVISLGGLVLAAGPVAKTVQGATGAVKGFMTVLSTPTGLVIAGAAAAVAAVAAIADAAIVTAEEQKERLNEVQADYERTQQEMQDTNNKIAETEKRIDELNKKDKLTFVEKEELSKLKGVNQTLKIQADLLSKKAQEAARNYAKEAAKTFDKLYKDVDVSMSAIQQKIDEANAKNLDGIGAIVIPQIDDIGSILANYTQLRDLLAEIPPKGSEDDRARWLEQMSNGNAAITDFLISATGYRAQLESSIAAAEAAGTPDQESIERLGSVKEMIRDIYLQFDPDQWHTIVFSDLIKTDGMQEAVDKLAEIQKAGDLTTETLGRPEYKELSTYLTENGISAEDFVENLQALSAESGNTSGALDGIAESTESVESALDRAKEAAYGFIKAQSEITGLSELSKKANKEIAESGEISQETLGKLVDRYPELSDAVSNYYVSHENAPALIGAITEAEKNRTKDLEMQVETRSKTLLADYEEQVKAHNKLVEDSKRYNADMETVNRAELEASKKLLKEKGEVFLAGGKTAAESYAEGARSKEAEATAAVENIVKNSASNAKTTAGGEGKEIGGAIVDGLISGMKGKQSELDGAWSALADYSTKEGKTSFKVNSPSKLTIPIGEALPEGVAVGVEKQKGLLRKAMSSLAEMATKSNLKDDFRGFSPHLNPFSASNAPPQTHNNNYGLTVNLTYTGEATRQEARDFGKELGNRMSRTLRERGITIPL